MTSTAKRIVVGYDGSSGADRAVDWAVQQATTTGAHLELVIAWQWPVMPAIVGVSPLCGYSPEHDAEQVAREGVKRTGLPPDRVTTHVVEGPSALRVVEQAKDADLLVVGSRGHNNFTDLMLGSVSSYCAHHAPCAVVIVRPER